MTYTCHAIRNGIPCNYTWTPRVKRLEQGREKPLRCPKCHSPAWNSTTPGNNVDAAIYHHKMHGDMDGRTCLLNECALHYPLIEKGD